MSKRHDWLVVVALISLCLTGQNCDGPSNSTTTSAECHGDLYVEENVVAHVTPQPKETYQLHSTHTWSAPYGIEVTGSGWGKLQLFDAANVYVTTINVKAASTVNGQATVKEANSFHLITLDAGNFYVNDNDTKKICNLKLLAHGVGISSVGTEFVVTIRPEIDEVAVAVIDGIVEVTRLEKTVTLDSRIPEQRLVVIKNGQLGLPQPVLDPGKLLEEVINGGDIVLPPPPNNVMTMWADDQLLPILEELAKQFETDTGVGVQITGMPINQMREQFLAALQAGTAPDLLTLPHSDLFSLAQNQLLAPIDLVINPELFVAGALQAFHVNDVYYGIPYIYTNLALVSNPERIPQIPPTWSELSTYAAELSYGEEFFTALLIPADGYHFFPVQSAFGGYIFGQNPDGGFNIQDFGMDNGGSLAAGTWLETLVKSEPYFTADDTNALQRYLLGDVAIFLTGPWSLQSLREGGKPYQINSFPREAQDSRPFISANGFVINRSSQFTQYAQDFISNYLTTPYAMQEYSRILFAPPARIDVLETLEDADIRAFGYAGISGIPIPNNPEMQYVWGPWDSAIQAIMSKTITSTEALNNATSQIRQSIYR